MKLSDLKALVKAMRKYAKENGIDDPDILFDTNSEAEEMVAACHAECLIVGGDPDHHYLDIVVGDVAVSYDLVDNTTVWDTTYGGYTTGQFLITLKVQP